MKQFARKVYTLPSNCRLKGAKTMAQLILSSTSSKAYGFVMARRRLYDLVYCCSHCVWGLCVWSQFHWRNAHYAVYARA